MKNVYVAAKFEEGERARAVMAKLRDAGFTITHDWTKEDATGKTGDELDNYLVACAHADVMGVVRADWVLALIHPNASGTLSELGGMIFDQNEGRGPSHVILVGMEKKNNIFFHLVPKRQRVNTDQEAIDLLVELAGMQQVA